MKVSRERAAENRDRIIDVAGRLFRERGLDGIGVANLMKAAGLTHGGGSGHFSSMEDLMVQACRRAVSTMLEEWKRAADAATANPLVAITVPYLSTGTGCLMAALGPEVSRQAAPVRRVVTGCLGSVLEFLARLTPGKSAAAKRKKAMAPFASMVGALVIARAVDDPKLSAEILQIVPASIRASDRA